MGKIIELIRVSDELVGSEIIKPHHRNTTIQRPVTKLYPLEIRTKFVKPTSPSEKNKLNQRDVRTIHWNRSKIFG